MQLLGWALWWSVVWLCLPTCEDLEDGDGMWTAQVFLEKTELVGLHSRADFFFSSWILDGRRQSLAKTSIIIMNKCLDPTQE